MKSKTFDLKIGPYALSLGLRGWQTWLGLSLALGALVSCCLLYSGGIGLLFAAGFCLAGTLRLQGKSPLWNWLLHGAWLIAMLGSLCIIAPALVGRFTFFEIGFRKPLLNLLICGIFCAGLLSITGRYRPAVIVGSFLLLVLAVVNSYVYIFRDRELAVLDIFTATTAMKVAQQYNYTPSPLMLYGTIAGLLALFFQACLPSVVTGRKLWVRLGALTGAILGTGLLYVSSLQDMPLRWNNEGSAAHGTYLNIYLGLRDCDMDPPKGYSAQEVDRIAQSFPQAQGSTGPNILVIMNEAYCDLDIYPNQADTNIPVTPFWDALKENTIRGWALASVYGGNTANSEFEFLTGSTMAFLPTGAVPYTQYLRQDSHSLAQVLKGYGYRTLATHNYDAQGWDREEVYPRLGFESSTFLEAYPQEDLLRGFVSDREQYEYLLSLLDEQEAPTFLFAVTMQNHGGYESDQSTYHHTVTLTELSDPKAEQYLSLLNASDRALEYLFTSLEERDEKTIVLFFGDHQPKLERSFYQKLNGGRLTSLESQMRQYTVPFVIWANYDIEEADLGLTSLNFLAGHLLDAAGLPRSAHHQYLGALEAVIPAMNLLGYYSPAQQTFLPYEQAQGDEKEALQAYQWVQYNQLFDPDNSNHIFFDLP